jgi:hypothetical protein
MKTKSAIAIFMLFFSINSTIRAHASSNIYFGVSLGCSSLNTPSYSAFKVSDKHQDTTVYQTESKDDAGFFGGGLYAGYNINQFLAVELGYTNYADTNYSSSQSSYQNSSPSEISTNKATLSYNTYSVDLFFKGTLPLQEKLSAFAKLGLSYVNQTVDYRNSTSGDTTINVNDDAFATPKLGKNIYTAYRPAGGMGFTYTINEIFSASLFCQGFIGSGNFETDQDAIASAYLVGASIIVNIM